MKSTYLLYDQNPLELKVPDHWSILEPQDPPAIGDLQPAIQSALEKPISADSLLSIAQRADKNKSAVIVISDITRAIPNKNFLPEIVHVLQQAGFEDHKIVILIATGMHRPSTPQERIELLGPQLSEKYRVIDHHADDPKTLTDLPHRTTSGTSVRINSVYYNAGMKILTGFIEPHFMAGFSGGRKTICPGLVDLSTLQQFHGFKILNDPRSRIGNLEANPCHQEALEVARMARPDFIFNVTVNAHGRITGIFAGDLEKAHQSGVEFIRKNMTVRVERPFDVVFTSGGGYPLDTTFYQTGKGMVVAGQYVKPGGKVIIASGCKHGIGSKIFRDILFQYDHYKPFLANISKNDQTQLDQWGLQIQTRVLEKVGLEGLIAVCDNIDVNDLRRCHVTAAEDIVGAGNAQDQINRLVDLFAAGGQSVAVMPRGPYILPDVQTL
ncbi:MAG: nickel-dependent lactate racemase [Phycisphaerae bacterium]